MVDLQAPTFSEEMKQSSGKRKEVVTDIVDDHSSKKRGKRPLSPHASMSLVEPTAEAVEMHVGTYTTTTSTCSRWCILPWRGEQWSVLPTMQQNDSTAVTNPMPVRVPSSMLSPLSTSEPPDEASEWVLGLAIHSYVRSDRQELMYVVLLDDGGEVHIPCGEVERIAIVKPCESKEVSVAYPGDSDFLLPGGHPSSQEKIEDSNVSLGSSYSTLLRSSAGQDFIADDQYKDSSKEGNSYPDCLQGSAMLNAQSTAILPPCTAEVHASPHITGFQGADIGTTHQIAVAEQENARAEILPHTESFARLFHNVIHDYVPLSTGCAQKQRQIPRTPPLAPSPLAAAARWCSRNAKPTTAANGDEASCSQRRSGLPVASKRTVAATASAGRCRVASVPTTSDAATEESPATVTRAAPRGPRLTAAAERLAFLRRFAEETWTMEHSTFTTPPPTFSGAAGGPTFPILRMPTKSALFGRFWSETTLRRICMDTNRYASELHPETHFPLGGPNWWPLEKLELKAFLAVNLLMGIKRLPNHRSYWNRGNEFLYCPSISSIMTSRRYEDITRCLHVADDSVPAVAGADAEFDKLRKMRWLVTELQQRFKSNWNLYQEVTVDETMIPYKGKYCPVRQYLPRKPTKWGVKVWCLADARQKYIYDFQIYTGSLSRESLIGGGRGDAKTGHEVVMQLMEGLHGLGHVVCTDNFFTSVKLLLELRSRGTFGVGTARCSRLGLPTSFHDMKNLSKEPQGTLLWRMHRSREIAAIVFVDRKAVLMLSTYYPPIPGPGEAWPTVPRRINGNVRNLDTSPVHKAYSNFMRGVDVADHLRGSYSSQTRSHKWWHKLFFYLLDTSVVNCYILNKAALEELGKDPVSHLQFQLQLADELSRPWSLRRGSISQFRLSVPGVHGLVRSGRRRKCRFCMGSTRTNLVCPQCGGVFLHSGDCFQRSHYVLRR